MWETAFEENMLNASPGIAILCQDEHLAEELFEIFESHGVMENWANERPGTRWETNRENTVYCVRGKTMLFGPKDNVESVVPYSRYKRCTFYGIAAQDFDVATDDELMAFLGIGGG